MWYFTIFILYFFFFSSRRRHTRYIGDWSSDVCSSDLDPVIQRIKPELRFLLGLSAQFLSQLRNFLRQPWLFHRFRRRLSCGGRSLRRGHLLQGVSSASYRPLLPAGPLRSTNITPLPRYHGSNGPPD